MNSTRNGPRMSVADGVCAALFLPIYALYRGIGALYDWAETRFGGTVAAVVLLVLCLPLIVFCGYLDAL